MFDPFDPFDNDPGRDHAAAHGAPVPDGPHGESGPRADNGGDDGGSADLRVHALAAEITHREDMRYTLSGVAREAFAGFDMPRKTPIFEPTLLVSAPLPQGSSDQAEKS